MRTEIVNKALIIAGLGSNDDENNNKEVLSTRVKHNIWDIENICNSICEMINYFDAFINKDVLFNIKAGRKASTAADHYLLTKISDGKCTKATKKSKIVNFATESFVKENLKGEFSEISRLKSPRNLFACLLYLAVAVKGFV